MQWGRACRADSENPGSKADGPHPRKGKLRLWAIRLEMAVTDLAHPEVLPSFLVVESFLTPANSGSFRGRLTGQASRLGSTWWASG